LLHSVSVLVYELETAILLTQIFICHLAMSYDLHSHWNCFLSATFLIGLLDWDIHEAFEPTMLHLFMRTGNDSHYGNKFYCWFAYTAIGSHFYKIQQGIWIVLY
jgi:hypothetical protein